MEHMQWMPVEPANAPYDVAEICRGAQGITVVLVPDRPSPGVPREVRLTWDASQLIAYHVTDETYRADCWNPDSRFRMRSASAYIEQMRQKSPLFPANAMHFSIIGTNTIIDLLATALPEVHQ